MADISVISPDGGTTELNIKDATARTNIGDLSALTTTAKTNLVAAVNEVAAGGGGGGTTDYTALSNKPQINSVTLTGNKSLSDLGIQGTLTFDDAPTANSNNPVKSGGIKTALDDKMSYADNGVLGAKNLLNAPDITVSSGTWIMQENVSLPPETYIYSFDVSGTPASGKAFTIADVSTGTEVLLGTGSLQSGHNELQFTTATKITAVKSYQNNTTEITISNFMIRLASDPDDTYAPHAMTNRELTESKDDWTSTATVDSNNQVTFTGLNDSYGYSLYCNNGNLVGITAMEKTGSGTSVQIVFTLSNVSQGDTCKLRVLKG